MAELGEPMAVGRTSEVFAVPGSDDLVLKLFLAGTPEDDIVAEVRGTAVAAAAGLTPVSCHETVVVGDRTGLLLDRLDGESLTRIVERNPLRLHQSARTLAGLQAGMHDVPAPDLPEVRSVVLAALERAPFAFLDPAGRDRVRRAVAALPDGDRLLHLDYHPENVFTTPAGGYAIIDWQTALRGAPAADAALSNLIFTEGEAWPGTPFLKRVLLAVSRREYARVWRKEYRRRTGLSAEEMDRWRLPALVIRLSWDIDSERQRLRAALRDTLAGLPQ